jgi:hypothetical protein
MRGWLTANVAEVANALFARFVTHAAVAASLLGAL